MQDRSRHCFIFAIISFKYYYVYVCIVRLAGIVDVIIFQYTEYVQKTFQGLSQLPILAEIEYNVALKSSGCYSYFKLCLSVFYKSYCVQKKVDYKLNQPQVDEIRLTLILWL